MPFVYSLLTNYISAKKFALRSRPRGLSLPMPTAYSQKISPKIVKIWSTNRNKQNYMSIRSTNPCKNTAKYTVGQSYCPLYQQTFHRRGLFLALHRRRCVCVPVTRDGLGFGFLDLNFLNKSKSNQIQDLLKSRIHIQNF